MPDTTFYPAFIDGEFTAGSGTERIEVRDPKNNKVWAEVPACTPDDVDAALASAKAAQPAWAALTWKERAGYIEKLNTLLAAKRDHFAKLLVLEQGKTLDQAGFEVDDTIGYMRYAAESARWLRGDIMPADAPNERLMTFKVPFGVCVAICAYNYPLALIGRKVGPALITGNTCIIKPHEATPVTASEFCKLVEEAGIPKGVINMVTGDGLNVGSPLVSDMRTGVVSITGSILAGQRIAAAASKNLAHLVLELGGKAPFIVMADADLDAAVEAAVIARFANSGQVCICNEMTFVDRRIAAEFTDKLLAKVDALSQGDPMLNKDVGPVTTPGARDRIHALVTGAAASGAEILRGGTTDAPEADLEGGYWLQPTVIAANDPHAPLIKDEIFGPVLPILQIEDFDEAAALVNGRDDGLSAYVWSKSSSTINKAIDTLETGTVFVNKGISGSFHGYHNGHKLSGVNGEDGPYGLENYMQKRSVYLAY